jgi:hypothetical protein
MPFDAEAAWLTPEGVKPYWRGRMWQIKRWITLPRGRGKSHGARVVIAPSFKAHKLLLKFLCKIYVDQNPWKDAVEIVWPMVRALPSNPWAY